MLKTKRFILLIFISILSVSIGYLFIPIHAYMIFDCYYDSPMDEMIRISKELDGELSYGRYSDSKKYNQMNNEQDIYWFLIEYNDTRLGIFRQSVSQKYNSEINTLFPGIIAKLSYGTVTKDGILVDLNDPYGDTEPPWRWSTYDKR